MHTCEYAHQHTHIFFFPINADNLLTSLSCSLVLSMRLVQNVRAATHAEIIIDLSEPSVKRRLIRGRTQELVRFRQGCTLSMFLCASVLYRIRVALPVKGPNLISSNGGWNPSMCSASSWEMGGRLQKESNSHCTLYQNKKTNTKGTSEPYSISIDGSNAGLSNRLLGGPLQHATDVLVIPSILQN